MMNTEPQIIAEPRCDVCGSKDVSIYDTKRPPGRDMKVRHYYCNNCPTVAVTDPLTGKVTRKRHTFKTIVV